MDYLKRFIEFLSQMHTDLAERIYIFTFLLPIPSQRGLFRTPGGGYSL